MQSNSRSRILIFILLVCVLVGPTLIRIAAQNPTKSPSPTPSTQKKDDPQKQQKTVSPSPTPAAQQKNVPSSSASPAQQKTVPSSPASPAQQKTVPSSSGSPAQQKADPAKKPDGLKAEQGEVLEMTDEPIKIDTGLVELDVTVIDQNNIPVFNLNKDNFTVYENKIKQPIESVGREEVPISYGVVIDASGSMRSKLDEVSSATVSLLRQMRPDDEGFVAQFKYETELIQGFTRDRRKLEKAIGDVSTGGGTALLDAIITTADYATKKAKLRRKALIIISDGLDRNSAMREKQVIDAIKESDVQVYLIGLVDEEDATSMSGGNPYKNYPFNQAKNLLTRLADESGGRAFFPKDVSEVNSIVSQISKDLRTQYIIRYYPTEINRNGTYRAVRVDINTKDNRRLVARTRQGYFARPEKESEKESEKSPNK